LAAVSVAAAVQQGRQSAQALPLDSQSTAPSGAAALRMWLSSLGYATQPQPRGSFAVPPRTGLMFLLEPTEAPTAAEWAEIDAWVTDGGVLVLAGEGGPSLLALAHYDVTPRFAAGVDGGLAPQSPLFQSPPVTTTVDLRAGLYLRVAQPGLVTHLAVPEGPVLVSWPQGAGRIVVSASSYAFSNAGLKQAGNPALVLNLLSIAPANARVWFDEWHHGTRSAETVIGPEAWLRSTPAGRALLYVGAVVFVALLLGGRSFGRPRPLPNTTARRAPLEFISALAHLGRRAGHSQAVLGQYRLDLKRQLGRRYRLDPSLADEVYVQRLAAYDARLDAAALRRLLDRLRQPRVAERELVQLAAEAADWTRNYG
jgi:hypothetical protein